MCIMSIQDTGMSREAALGISALEIGGNGPPTQIHMHVRAHV